MFFCELVVQFALQSWLYSDDDISVLPCATGERAGSTLEQRAAAPRRAKWY